MKILFKVYPQKSHYNATFPLAKDLQKQGNEGSFIRVCGCSKRLSKRKALYLPIQRRQDGKRVADIWGNVLDMATFAQIGLAFMYISNENLSVI
jgi:hypothetical protein